MSKVKDAFACTHCGYETFKWTGQCPDCSMWNTLVESSFGGSVSTKIAFQAKDSYKGSAKDIVKLDTIAQSLEAVDDRFILMNEELGRVFGGGITKASVTLLAGEPGIGKSTMTLSLALMLSEKSKVLYITGEESVSQIARRAKRIGNTNSTLGFVQENILENIIATIQEDRPEIVIIDSIQVMYSASLGSVSGSIGQIRFVTELLIETAKNYGITMIIIGHVTKDGNIAGPKALEHLVDTVLLLEGDSVSDIRFLRAEKNRFGPTDEIGVFQMKETGFTEVRNPSELFLTGKRQGASGSVISSSLEGSRAFLIEVQALTTYTKFGYPKRSATGYMQPRLELLLAVIAKYGGIQIDSLDVFVNVVGGLKVKDPSIDLAVLSAIISSRKNKPLESNILVFGEIGLTGEVRAVGHLDKRVKEAEKQGIKKLFLPASQVSKISKFDGEIVGLHTVEEAVSRLVSA